MPPVDRGRAEAAAPARVSTGGESSTSSTESGEASSSDGASDGDVEDNGAGHSSPDADTSDDAVF